MLPQLKSLDHTSVTEEEAMGAAAWFRGLGVGLVGLGICGEDMSANDASAIDGYLDGLFLLLGVGRSTWGFETASEIQPVFAQGTSTE